jgi:Flp pilus assembly protein TadD
VTSVTLDRAAALLELGRWDAAAEQASQALSSDPGSVEAMCLLARCHNGAGRFDEAVAMARAAVAAAPGNDRPLRLLALFAAKAKHVDEAVRAASDAVRIDPEFWANHLALASALIDAGRHAEAVAPAWEAVRLAPHEEETHNILGIAFWGSGDKVRARAAFLEALRIDPQHALARNNLAVLDVAGSRLGDAAQGIAAGLRHSPQESVLRENLDVVGEALLARLLNTMLLTGFLVVIVFGLEAGGIVPPWWPRAMTGLVLIGAYAAVAWSTLRHFPSGMRRVLRSLPRRSQHPWRWAAMGVVTTSLLLCAFLPGSVAVIGAALFVLVIRCFQLLLVISVVRWIYRAVRGRL